jgi:hypothetical protein
MFDWLDEVGRNGGINLVLNPSFELMNSGEPLGWKISGSTCNIDSSICRTGQKSLRLEKRNTDACISVTQRINLIPGRKYALIAWIRPDDVHGPVGNGVGVCLEWIDEDCEPLDGVYPMSLRGTGDWQPTGMILNGPKIVNERMLAGVRVVLYMHREITGTAWFDDVQVREMLEPLLEICLPELNKEGSIKSGQARKLCLDVTSKRVGDLRVSLDNQEIHSSRIGEGLSRIKLTIPRMKRGKRQLTSVLCNEEGDQIGYGSLTFTAIP